MKNLNQIVYEAMRNYYIRINKSNPISEFSLFFITIGWILILIIFIFWFVGPLSFWFSIKTSLIILGCIVFFYISSYFSFLFCNSSYFVNNFIFETSPDKIKEVMREYLEEKIDQKQKLLTLQEKEITQLKNFLFFFEDNTYNQF